jgi:hypothetical protein
MFRLSLILAGTKKPATSGSLSATHKPFGMRPQRDDS